MNASHDLKWSIEADIVLASNGSHGCPLELAAPLASGSYEYAVAWRVNRGQYGAIRLDRLGVALAARWPGAAHQGRGDCVQLVDNSANPSQAEALLNICGGKAGGPLFATLAASFARFLPPVFAQFSFKLNGRNSSVRAGNALSLVVEPIKNPATGQPEFLRLIHSTGQILKDAECVTATTLNVNAGELKFSWQNQPAFVGQVKYGN